MTQSELASEAEISLRTIQLAESGKSSVRAATIHRITDAIGLRYNEAVLSEHVASYENAERQDAFSAWPWSLSQYVQGTTSPSDLSRCGTKQDAEWAIHSMRASWNDHLHRSQSHQCAPELHNADRKLNQAFDDYLCKYLQIWETNPDTFRFSIAGQERSGVCVVLPVTDTAYDDIRYGHRSFMQIGATDILPESQKLILDSAVEIPCASTRPWYQITDSLSFTLFYQLALLSTEPCNDGFRMLGFAASPTNLQRLRRMGFVDCDVTMPQYGYAIYEFSVFAKEQAAEAGKRAATTTHYVNLYKKFSLKSAMPAAAPKTI